MKEEERRLRNEFEKRIKEKGYADFPSWNEKSPEPDTIEITDVIAILDEARKDFPIPHCPYCDMTLTKSETYKWFKKWIGERL